MEVVHVAITMTSQVFLSVKKEDRNMTVMAILKETSFSLYCQQLHKTAKAIYQERLHMLGIIEDPNMIFSGLLP